jgi:hypothetical protein
MVRLNVHARRDGDTGYLRPRKQSGARNEQANRARQLGNARQQDHRVRVRHCQRHHRCETAGPQQMHDAYSNEQRSDGQARDVGTPTCHSPSLRTIAGT